MRLLPAVAALMTVAGLSEPAVAKDPLVLEPSSRWEVDYAEDSCALRRQFGEGDQLTQLEMRRYQPGAQLETTVASKVNMPRKSMNLALSENFVRIRLGNEGEWIERYAMTAEFGDDFQGVIFQHSLSGASPVLDDERKGWTGSHIETLATLEATAGAGADSLTVSGAFKDDVTLEAGPFKAPLAALNSCIDDLLAHWGLDVAAHKTRARSAGPINLAGRFIVEPPAKRMGRWGPARVRLAISETGEVTECHVQLPPGESPSEEIACARIRDEFAFESALDNDGQPMKSYYIAKVGPVVTAVEVRYGAF